MKTPPIVSPQEWEAARQELLVKEKELTRARDALAARRRRMPWLPVTTEYRLLDDVHVSLLYCSRATDLIVYRPSSNRGARRRPACSVCRGRRQVADVAH